MSVDWSNSFQLPPDLFFILTALLQEFGDQPRPASLMAGTYSAPVVAVEVFMEGNEIVPVGISLKLFYSAKHWTPPRGVLQEDA